VLLGASNLTFGLRTVVAAARARLGAPLDVLSAQGCGRSYRSRQSLLGRTLVSIDACGLWRALAERPKLPTYALLTDFGNDLGYGSRAEQVEPWIARALDRLQPFDAQIVVTGLPLASLQRMPAWEFGLWARVLFPLRRIERTRLLVEAEDLERRIVELARTRGLARVEPQLAWYGRDPIHVARAHRAAAWGAYVAGWKCAPHAGATSPLRIRGRAWYEQVRVFGVERGRAQPSAGCADGSMISLY
jgi:hypothetical protein